MQQKDYYLLLGVNHHASTQEIKVAFRDLAKKYHPDKNIDNKDAEDYFKEIQQAYSILSNAGKRRKYDSGMGYSQNYFRNYATPQQKTSSAGKREIEKPDKSEHYYFLICIVIAALLLYFIVSYSSK